MPLFQQDWWMDAVCMGEKWDIVANMPCLIKKRFGFRYIQMPPLTPYAAYYSTNSTYQSSVEQANLIQRELQKGKFAYYQQTFPPSSPIPDCLRAIGFYLTDINAACIFHPQDPDAVFQSFTYNKRSQIQKSIDHGLTVCSLTAEEFYAFHQICQEAKHRKMEYSLALLQSIDRACAEHDARHIIGIRDEDGKLYSACYMVEDNNTCYYLIPCYHNIYHESGAGSRLVWEGIQWAIKRGKNFEFAGGDEPGIANHYAQYSPSPISYRVVEQMNSPVFAFLMMLDNYRQRNRRS